MGFQEDVDRNSDFRKRAMAIIEDCADERFNRGWKIGRIVDQLNMAYGRGLYDVKSSPWEYLSHPILTDAARNDAIMNGMASQGWELQFVSSGWHFWRRGKAVAEIAAKENQE